LQRSFSESRNKAQESFLVLCGKEHHAQSTNSLFGTHGAILL
jgi:hypothetical protein